MPRSTPARHVAVDIAAAYEERSLAGAVCLLDPARTHHPAGSSTLTSLGPLCIRSRRHWAKLRRAESLTGDTKVRCSNRHSRKSIPKGAANIGDFVEWLNFWLSIPLSILGFGLSIWGVVYAIMQVAKTKNAAEEARDSAKRSETLLLRNQLILLIPILHRNEGDLENAVEHDERRLVQYHLSSWRWHSSQFRSYLGNHSEDKKLAKAVQASIALAAETKLSVNDTTKSLGDICAPVREAIAVVTGELGRLAADETSKAG